MFLRVSCVLLLAVLLPCVGVSQSGVADSVLVSMWARSSERLRDTALGAAFADTLVQRFVRARRIDLELPALRGLGDRVSSDGSLRVLSWGHETPVREWHYMAVLVRRVGDDSLRVWRLYDAYDAVREGLVEESMLTAIRRPASWLGAAYYAVLPFSHRGVAGYLLLGVAGGNLLVTRRVVEVLTFDHDGSPVFGVPLIAYGKRKYGRLLFTHSARAEMTIHPIDGGRRVLLDHLSPSRPQYVGMPQYYGPDFSQDVLALQGDGMWLFEADQVVVPE